jgi:hypothetical protein
MKFHCFGCNIVFEAEYVNLANIKITCPVCATYLDIAQALIRAYPDANEKQISDAMGRLEKYCAKSKGDCSEVIWHTYDKLCQLTEEASHERNA